WRPVQAPLKGVISSSTIKLTLQKIAKQIDEQDANFILLWIDSAGGSYADSMDLANYLARLDSSRIRTVAYIPTEARGDAALVALACDQIIMGPNAVIGGAGAAVIDETTTDAAVRTLQE